MARSLIACRGFPLRGCVRSAIEAPDPLGSLKGPSYRMPSGGNRPAFGCYASFLNEGTDGTNQVLGHVVPMPTIYVGKGTETCRFIAGGSLILLPHVSDQPEARVLPK